MKLKKIDPRYCDLIAILLIGGVTMLMHEYKILDYPVPVMMAFYFLGKWVQRKFGSAKEYDKEVDKEEVKE